jgi:hypothetical protein
MLWLQLSVARRVAIRGVLQADPVTAHRLRLHGLAVARGTVSFSPGRHRIRLRVSRSVARHLAGLARGGVLTVRLVGTDAAGARTLVQSPLRLR